MSRDKRGNRTQEVVGSIPIGSTKIRHFSVTYICDDFVRVRRASTTYLVDI
jgi:hypothetical protein